MIVLSHASRVFTNERQTKVVLRDISLIVAPGSRVGIFGAYGSGKSILARLAAKVENPNTGTVTHVGRVSWPIGFGGYLHKEMTGADNVRTIAGLTGAHPEKLLAHVVAFSGLGSVMRHRVGTYASFERDRLAIALALGIPTDTYVFDGLPGLGGADFQMRCLQAMEERLGNAGLLFLSRNKRHLERMCDTFFALKDGTLHPAYSADDAEALAQADGMERRI